MDSHLLIIIACVFLASLFSLLFINKFFRRKTFEEIVAEKKALTEKIYGKSERTTFKKPRKLTNKKDLKREKKQKQREQPTTSNEPDDSDVHSEQQQSADDESIPTIPANIPKTSVENVQELEMVQSSQGSAVTAVRRASNIEKENTVKPIKGNKKEKKVSAVQKSVVVAVGAGKTDSQSFSQPLSAKDEKVVVENASINISSDNKIHSNPPLNDLKKSSEKKDMKVVTTSQSVKKEKNGKKNDNREKNGEKSINMVESNISEPVAVANQTKEVKQADERSRAVSPKPTQSSKSKQQNKKHKESKDTAALDSLTDRDIVSVSLLMNLFRRAELNRSEIQILIDYLLNRQQDMPTSHSEWSDDVCQKLKRQLKEAEKALAEEQEASIGIQAKLRELRAEINSERATLNITLKSYMEKLQVKDQDIAILEQKIKTLNDNLALERQQFQAKLIHEKQTATQDLLAQIQLMQNDLAHKDKCIAELTCIVNASRQAVEESQQKNDIIQQQAQQLRVLEQQRDELEQVSNNRIFELEKAKQVENELNEIKLELRNLQNALESAKSDANQSRLAAEAIRNDAALAHTQLKNITNKAQEQTKEQSDLQAAHEALKQQLAEKEIQLANAIGMETKLQQQLGTLETTSKEQADQHLTLNKMVEMLRNQIESHKKQLQEQDQILKQQQVLEKLTQSLKKELSEKEAKLLDYDKMIEQHKELQKSINALKEEIADKQQQLQKAKQQAEKSSEQEQQLLEELKEQKLKNNELRLKNWKLVEALQNAETKAIKDIEKVKQTTPNQNINLVEQQKLLATSAQKADASSNKDIALEERRVRELFQRLYPDAVKACAATALSVSLEQWMEQVITTYSKQQQQQVNSSHKSTQSTGSIYSLNSSAAQNSQNGKDSRSNSPAATAITATAATTSPEKTEDDLAVGNSSDPEAMLNENKLLRIRIDELTQLARKTDNMVSDLKHRAKEQDEHWRSVLQSKDEEISALRHSNGQQEDI